MPSTVIEEVQDMNKTLRKDKLKLGENNTETGILQIL